MPIDLTPDKDILDRIIDAELDAALHAVSLQEETESFFQVNLLALDPELIPKFSDDTYGGYHHITWWVSNAKQSAFYFITLLGFELYAYKGLETGSREVCSYVVRNGDSIFEFCSPLRTNSASEATAPTCSKSINEFLEKHGDGVKDVAFKVSSLEQVFHAAIKGGAKVIEQPTYFRDCSKEGELAYIAKATIQIFGDTYHTLVEKSDSYPGFLPDYELIEEHPKLDILHNATFIDFLPRVEIKRIDHCVQNQGWNKMNSSRELYSKTLGFHQFWSVDEKQVSTEFSALRSIVMASPDDMIKMPINEPAKGRCKSQIEEFLDFYDGPGVQHIALLTENIIDTVSAMKDRGVEFIEVPEKYYANLKERMEATNFKTNEDFEAIKQLGLLVDFDENGYLLQLFTKPLVVRPTIFIEIIQRENHNGFGAGNFKALFETLELLQSDRGNLTSLE